MIKSACYWNNNKYSDQIFRIKYAKKKNSICGHLILITYLRTCNGINIVSLTKGTGKTE